jgi:hypothetical protein
VARSCATLVDAQIHRVDGNKKVSEGHFRRWRFARHWAIDKCLGKLIATEIKRIEASATASRPLDVPRLKRLLDEWPKYEQAAQLRSLEYRAVLDCAVHVGNFIRWVERGNA